MATAKRKPTINARKSVKKPTITVNKSGKPVIPDNLKKQVAQWNRDVKILKAKAEKLRGQNPNTASFKKQLAELQKEKDRLEKAKAHIALLAGRRGLVVNNKQ